MTPDFKLTERQIAANRMLGDPQRHTLLVGGSRSGKTFLIIRAIIIRAAKAANSRHLITRLRANAVRASVWLDTFPKVRDLCFPDLPMTEHRQDGYFELPNGSEIWFGGLDDKERVDKILGQEYATIFPNECSQIPYSSIKTLLTRLAQRAPGLVQRAYYDLNPVGVGHWTNRLFVQNKNVDNEKKLRNPDQYALMYMNPEDNKENLDPAYLDELRSMSARHRQRFYEGKYVSEVEGALWTADMIESSRVSEDDVPDLKRVAVAVDPSGASGPEDYRSDEIGIIAAGRGVDDHAYVKADNSLRASPEVWGRIAVDTYNEHEADLIVAERNFGGEMVAAVIRAVDPHVPVKLVTASRGKVVRAEPVAALYEKDKIHHVGRFPRFEDQLTNFTTAGYVGDKSPDRADAGVWGLTELMLKTGTGRAVMPHIS